MINEIRPDVNKEYNKNAFKIFLAGTIDNGTSENWQRDLVKKFNIFNKEDLVIFNPRRDNWYSKAGSDEVEKQIKWEQDKLDEADIIIMVFKDDSKSPISLLELGLYASTSKLLVFCSAQFYRFTNVKMTCKKYFVPLNTSTSADEILTIFSQKYDEIKRS